MTKPIYTSLQKRTDNFLKKAKEVHGDRYDYSLVEYIKNKVPVYIICPEHGSFPQTPAHHLKGQGCPECGIISSAEKKISKAANEFVKKSKEIHGDKYDYSLVEYKGSDVYVNIICPEHGSFPQTPHNHLNGKGCPECGTISQAKKIIAKAAEEFEKKAKLIHNDRYDYSKVEYIKNSIPVNIICPEHGSFPQTPASHLSQGSGCPDCGNISSAKKKITKAAKEFEKKSKEIHGDKYDYSLVEYKGSDVYVDLICPEHGIFPQTPDSHLTGKGCPQCSTNGYSKIAIEWLNSISLDIQHAENGGEFKIVKSDGTHFKADGYDPLTNTIYEFHGDCWHGNPELFSPDETPHPFNKTITAGELHQNTIQRENEIKSLGYNLVVMWEQDYKLTRNVC